MGKVIYDFSYIQGMQTAPYSVDMSNIALHVKYGPASQSVSRRSTSQPASKSAGGQPVIQPTSQPTIDKQ